MQRTRSVAGVRADLKADANKGDSGVSWVVLALYVMLALALYVATLAPTVTWRPGAMMGGTAATR